MEIQVGDYVKIKSGEIRKVIEILSNYEEYDVYKVDKQYIDRECQDYYTDIVYPQDIVKHSKNKIDLIEQGDYINGIKIETILQVSHKHKSIIVNNEEEILEEDIKSIVTHEQFSQVEYEV